MEDDYGMIDDIINNGPRKTVAELKEQSKTGTPISLLELAQNFEAAPPAQQAAALKSEQSPVSCFTVRLSNVARMLCSLFVIEKLYLSGPAAASPAFMRGVVQKLKSPEMRPVVLNPDPVHTPAFMATDLRQSLLCSMDA
mgnify:FL=1